MADIQTMSIKITLPQPHAILQQYLYTLLIQKKI